jgi:hypothetical protein
MGQTCGILPVGIDSAYVKTEGLKWNLGKLRPGSIAASALRTRLGDFFRWRCLELKSSFAFRATREHHNKSPHTVVYRDQAQLTKYHYCCLRRAKTAVGRKAIGHESGRDLTRRPRSQCGVGESRSRCRTRIGETERGECQWLKVWTDRAIVTPVSESRSARHRGRSVACAVYGSIEGRSRMVTLRLTSD